ncbi:FMN-binding negative transcriptional regulator [Salipiger sp. P9]|uniref:FMN-binding negative transcriptional regulator n=1 Tax=Salipiger pentaromativorans TaxID=2943193 RepID=UPI0021585C1D|nr:FMN-binding negative transcriptional regulator [Salipiger pentaromativorans]MCR8549410.1 FMN-binding negative transcriptional regulator [Salipiger pentaromativorans]
MHPNPTFRGTPEAQSLSFVRDRAFGTLAVSTQGAPLLSHVPFLLSADGTHADLHLVRSNPICRAMGDALPARLAVNGPDGYVSPDWYALGPEQVPTWNYVAVHLTGRLIPLPTETLEPMLAAQSAGFETRLPKTPWTLDKMSDEAKRKLLRMILPFRLEIETVDSTWKLGQNKPEPGRLAAAEAVEGGIGQELAALAQLMRTPPES